MKCFPIQSAPLQRHSANLLGMWSFFWEFCVKYPLIYFMLIQCIDDKRETISPACHNHEYYHLVSLQEEFQHPKGRNRKAVAAVVYVAENCIFFYLCSQMRQNTLVKNKVCLKLNAWVQLWFWDLLILLCLLLFCLFSFWHWQKNSLFALDVAFLWCCSLKCRLRQEVILYWEAEFLYTVTLYSTVYNVGPYTKSLPSLPASCSCSTWKNVVTDTIWNLKMFDILNTQLYHDHKAVMLHLG